MTPLAAAAASGAVKPGGSRDGSAGRGVPSLLREEGWWVGWGGVKSLTQETLHHCSGAAALSLSSEVIDHGRQQQTCASQLSGGRGGGGGRGWKGDADLDKGSPASHTSHSE